VTIIISLISRTKKQWETLNPSKSNTKFYERKGGCIISDCLDLTKTILVFIQTRHSIYIQDAFSKLGYWFNPPQADKDRGGAEF
jgi:hypothetical protein